MRENRNLQVAKQETKGETNEKEKGIDLKFYFNRIAVFLRGNVHKAVN
jgi:hypothetical protein